MIYAIIGGIGAGKSAVLAYFKESGNKTFSADEENRKLWKNKDYLKKLNEIDKKTVRFGKVNVKYMKKRLFSDIVFREEVEELSHPLIMNAIFSEAAKAAKNETVFVEITAVREEYAKKFDRIIYVKAEKAVRIKRAEERGATNVEQIMAAQPSAREFEAMADVTVENNGTLKELHEKLAKLY